MAKRQMSGVLSGRRWGGESRAFFAAQIDLQRQLPIPARRKADSGLNY
jgi:hypothetical protein